MKILQVLVLIFGLTIFVNAQKVNLSGKIYDASGAVIPGIKISAYSEEALFEQTTNEEGFFILSLPLGIYNLEINPRTESFNGFQNVSLKNYRIVSTSDGKLNLDFSLPTADSPICILDISGDSSSPRKLKQNKVKKNKSIKRKIINNE